MIGLKDLPLFPEQASNFATKIDAVYFGILAITTFFTILVAVLVIVFAIQYRKGSKAKREPMSHRTALMMEITWTTIPAILAVGMFLWSAAVFTEFWNPPANATDIWVVGKQWMWKIQHQSGKREINELHLPVGRPVRLVMTSQDVIHDFYVPAFRTKMDVLPGRYTTQWFIPTKTGKFHLFCAEYCGTQHAKMIGTVTVMEPGDFAKWMSGTAGEGGSLAERGEKTFGRLGCATCHLENGTGRAPSLKGVYGGKVRLTSGAVVKADETYLRESIVDPRAKVVMGYEPVMPTFKNQVSDDQIVELLSYIKTLAGKSAADASAPTTSAAENKQDAITGAAK